MANMNRIDKLAYILRTKGIISSEDFDFFDDRISEAEWIENGGQDNEEDSDQ